MRRAGQWLLAATLALTLAPARAYPQSGGTLNGTVTDQTKGAMPGVTVNARNIATSDIRTGVTNDRGFYTLAALPVGTYEVYFELPGFKVLRRENVRIEAAVPVSVDATLEVGGISEVVTVDGAVPIVPTSTAAVSRQLSAAEVQAVPSATRNFTHLLTATAGVSADLPGVATNDAGSISPSVNGTKATSNSVLYNGVDVTSLLSNSGSLDESLVPAPETIQEVKLQTSLYDASAGRSGGGNFQLVTKAGSNSFDGSVYVFAQHERFNSNDFFFARDGIAKPRMRRAETGFTLGGPLRRNAAFFFGSFQYTDAETGYVPTASTRALLPAALALITGARTPENIVSAFRQLNPAFALTPAMISPLALQLLNARNPATGGFFIPAPTGRTVRSDARTTFPGLSGSHGGDPLAEFRQAIPAAFEQLQGSARTDVALTASNRLQVAYFGASFPSLDPFPDPSSMVSPWTLRRSNNGRVASVTNTHVFGRALLNEARVGYFDLRNTRRLDDQFLAITGEEYGIDNPALAFDSRDATRRLGHFIANGSVWSFGGTNDSFNRREQQSVHVADALTWIAGNHSVRSGAEFKLHRVGTNLPEEQATEFEKITNFQEFLLGFTSEADTQFGFTEKNFRARDAAWFVRDDWRVSGTLTLNLGLRWDWYGWPYEKDGYLGNFDPARVSNPDNPLSGFVVPRGTALTGFPQIDSTVALLARSDARHTLRGEDLNNLAPRLGFAWTQGDARRAVVRGGYGVFYDRPSAAFMNTVFSNYPFLREVEIPTAARPIDIRTAFAQQTPDGTAVEFSRYFPYRLTFSAGQYRIFDSTGIGPNGGNLAETVEFRAIDSNLRTPFYQHWNVGYARQLSDDLAVEVRYNGSRGHDLLLATALNQPWDLNSPDVPQEILARITTAYRAGGGGANAEDPAALGYGYLDPTTGRADRNLGPGGRLIPGEARGLYLGFNDAEAILLQSKGRSTYHALQASLTKRLSHGVEFHAAYTLSRSKDIFSADPGSTAGSGRPDEPNRGFSVENDSRNLEASYARSDFDRPHRLSVSGTWTLPLGNHPALRDWQIATFMQFQSGRPFSVYTAETDPLMRLAFGRLDFAPGADENMARQPGDDDVERWFNVDAVRRAFGPGSTPRNLLRGPGQARVDLSVSKVVRFGDVAVEFRAELFNAFNRVNLDQPVNNLDNPEFGRILNTLGGPRVSQFGLRLTF
jgi:hypothetical protein